MFLGLMQTYATVVRGPMLQGASTSNIYVLAECTVGSSSPMSVYYGTTTNYVSTNSTVSTKSTSASPISYVHSIKLTGLLPNTLYHYQLTGQGLTSSDYTFQTLVNPGTAFRWAWSCDFRNGTAVHNQIADQIHTNYDATGPTPVLFNLAPGDFAIDNTYADWTSQWITTNEQGLEASKCAFLAPGNHEGTWGSSSSNMVAFDQPPDSTGTTGYYSFDCGDMHVTVGNYMDPGGYAVGSTQYNWIQQDVQASLKAWKVFGVHDPAYTYGGSGAHTGDTAWQTVTSNILQPNAVKVFLAGHNHFYQHVLTNGIHHIVCGGAGAPLYAVSSSPPAAVLKSFSSNCFMIVDVNATNLHMVAYDNLTPPNVLETIDLWKLPAPTSVVATAGDSQVTLNWNTVTGATNYTVRFGTTDGGPYSTVQAVTAPPLTRTGLTNGTAYYFVVSAVDSNGPSAISSQASASPSLPPGQLNVSPSSGLTSTGNAGGPFTPASQIYTLTNSGGASLSWTASNTATWLTLSATSGNLAGGSSTDITVSINASANGLAAGSYSDTVSFTNVTNGTGTTNRLVSLTVNPLPAQLSVSPFSGLASSGPVGGPFSPSDQVYTLSNTGSVAMDWTVSNTANWLSLSATSGNLAGGDSTNIAVSLNANANGLAAGSYSDTVSFTNATNGAGNATRSVTLTALTSFQVWQMQFFTCTDCPQAQPNADPFGKGISNTNQFLAGLNPTNPASVFRITSAVTDRSNNVLITWSAAGVRTNAVQVSGGDANGSFTTNFLDLATAPQIILPVSGDVTTNYLDVGGATNGPGRYYRIRLVP
jgi:hypothetical protein